MVAPLCDVVLSPVTVAEFAAIQVKVEAWFAVKANAIVWPEQMDVVFELVMAGAGFTVTLTVCAVPAHDPAVDVGVTV